MSESIPTYISCAAGANAQTDVLVVRKGDLVHLVGHPHMEFTLGDAKFLAKAILRLLDDEVASDPLVEAICEEFQSRSRLGQQKYGTKMTRTDLDVYDWVKHLKTELMDAVLYGEAALRKLEAYVNDGK